MVFRHQNRKNIGEVLEKTTLLGLSFMKNDNNKVQSNILKKIEEFQDHPFILKDLESLKINSKTLRTALEALVKDDVLGKRTLGRMNVYWKRQKHETLQQAGQKIQPTTPSKDAFTPEKKRIKDLEAIVATKNKQIEQLELQLNELQGEVVELRAKVRELQLLEGIDDPWKEIAMQMAEILAEMRGLTIKEVLHRFGVQDEMI